jgi:hypothetical protein
MNLSKDTLEKTVDIEETWKRNNKLNVAPISP